MRMSRTIPLLAVIALVSAPLVGCANPLEQLVKEGTERAIEEAIERETGVDIDVDSSGNASVPADFPSGFPQPNGRLAASMKVGDSWMLTYALEDIAEAEKLADWFLSNGFESTSDADFGELRTWSLASDEYSVTIGAVDGTNGITLQYTVSVRS